MDPMRVAVTLEQCWHRVPGGTATAALGTVRALAARPDVSVVGVAARHASPPPEAFRPTVPVARLGVPRHVLYETWHRFGWPRIERATGPVDVVHATGMAVPPRSAPLVVTLNDLAFRHDPSQFTTRGLRFFEASLRATRARADRVVVPSRATAADVVDAGIDADRVRVVPYGVDPTEATGAEVEAVRRRHGLDGPYLLWVGTLEPRKNLPTLLDAVSRLGDDAPPLVLVGPDGWGDAGVDAVDPTRVRALGFVSADELRALYGGAEVFCYPSLREGFGLPVLEAMAQGTPVVTSAGTSTAEVLGEDSGAGVAVDPRDPAALADAVAGLLAAGGRAGPAGEAARRRARSCSWEACADALVAVYREVVA